MKKLSVILISVILYANLFANDQQKDPFMFYAFPAASIKSVDANTTSGSITISGNATTMAVVEVYVSRDEWSSEKIKQTLEENYTIDIKVESEKLYAVVKQKNSRFNWSQQGLNISFKIFVPKEVNSILNTASGTIQISNLSGSLRFNTASGSLAVNNVSGKVSGNTASGSITLSDSNDNISMNTASGSITVKDCNGNIKLNTASGSIRANDLNGNVDLNTASGSITAGNLQGNIKTESSSGSIKIDGISGNLTAEAKSGSITVVMESVSEYVRLSNSGNTSLSLPAGKGYDLNVKANKVETSGLKDFRGNMANDRLEGAVGNGGAEIEIKKSQRASLSFQ